MAGLLSSMPCLFVGCNKRSTAYLCNRMFIRLLSVKILPVSGINVHTFNIFVICKQKPVQSRINFKMVEFFNELFERAPFSCCF